MSSNESFQLPDLLGIITGLQLRTNRHCRFATDASERWFAEGIKAPQPQAHTPFHSEFGSSMAAAEVTSTMTRTQLLSEAELKYLRSMKLGLLCALCFPLCDAPQLRVMTDLVTALFYSAMRESRCHGSLSSKGSTPSPENPPNLARPAGLELLRENDLFRQLLKRALSKASKSWTERCSHSIHAFFDARDKFSSWPSRAAGGADTTTSPPMTIEEYIEIRRELYGTSLILDFAELLEIYEFPQAQGALGEKIDKLRRAFSDILAFSMDVASYPLTHSRHPANPIDSTQTFTFNLISILIANKRLSLQGAMNLAGTMLKETYARFREAEQEVLDILDPPPPPPLSGPRLLRSRSLSVLSAGVAGVSTLGASLSSSASSFLGWVMKAGEEGAGAGVRRGGVGHEDSDDEDYGVLMPGGMASSQNLNLHAAQNTPAPSISISLSPAPSISPLSSSPSPSPSPSPSSSSSSSNLNLPDLTNIPIPPTIVTTKRYIQALKDCLVGTLHWAYETELFFGKKGSEVRAFGWVFVDQVPAIPGE